MATKKRAVVQEDKRIFVLLPEKVLVTQGSGRAKEEDVPVYMEPGRLMAQSAHVTSLMRGMEYLHYGASGDLLVNPITTIVLSVRCNKELAFLRGVLQEHRRITEKFRVYDFFDENSHFYGSPERVLTAVCTTPVEKSFVAPIIGHLELWGS